MNIAVIAANGRLGRAFVDEALTAGHSVTAGVHSKNTFVPRRGLSVMQCDATNEAQLKELISGQDVVVSCIGHVKGSAPDVQTRATKILVKVMDGMYIKRFVTVTGTGARLPEDNIGLVDCFLNMAVSVIDPPRISDGRNYLKVLQSSDLDWTVIRVLKLQNIAAQKFELQLHGPTKWYVGRAETAQAMMQVITDNSFIRQSPIISRISK